jgi:nifR3 family TIM-barrel protein
VTKGQTLPDGDVLRGRFSIGGLELERRVFMAPMAGITTPSFRRSVRRWGAGLVFTEMISACGIHYRNQRTEGYLVCAAADHPVGFQLFGADPHVLAEAAAACVAAGADLVDLNMACPVRKVTKTGAGAALLGDADRAVAIVAAVKEAVGPAVPVTVKIRSGLREGDELGRRVAPRLVAAGAAAICIHPRSAAQLYRGRADHAVTLALAADLPVPVIAARGRGGRGDAGAPCSGSSLAVRRDPRGRPSAAAGRHAAGIAPVRRRRADRHGASRGRPSASVLAALPAPGRH